MPDEVEEQGFADASELTWAELFKLNKDLATNLANSADKYIAELSLIANDAFVRKSKLLTAANASGLISVVGYMGAKSPGFNYLIASILCVFFLGLLTNGWVLRMAEKRHAKRRNDFITLKGEFTEQGSTMTWGNFLNEDNISDGISIEDGKRESRLEDLSGILFIVGFLLLACLFSGFDIFSWFREIKDWTMSAFAG
jgi:hypothetical protein